MRERLSSFFESEFGRWVVISIILLNAVLLGVSTYPAVDLRYGALLDQLDHVFLVVFTVELVLRLYAAGSARAYVRDPWNVFDFILILLCWLPFGGALFTVGRMLRVLRTLRAISMFSSLRDIVTALLHSLPAMGHVAFLLGLLVYVYSVVGTHLSGAPAMFGKGDQLIGATVPHYFGSLHRTWLTLFQVVTLEGWNDILADVLAQHPLGWAYLVSYIFLGTFTLFNLFVGVIVSNLEAVTHKEEEQIEARIDALTAEVRALREALQAPRGYAPPRDRLNRDSDAAKSAAAKPAAAKPAAAGYRPPPTK